jgi:nitrogen regulatory protein P-II 1
MPAIIGGLPAERTAMKKIEAIIKPFKLEDVREALQQLDLQGITVIEVEVLGRPNEDAEVFMGADSALDLLPRIKIEIVLRDDVVAKAVELIHRAAQTGRVNDGRIFVSAVETAIRIRTGETGAAAL